MNTFPPTKLGERFELQILPHLIGVEPQKNAFSLEMMSSAEFLATEFELEWLVSGILVAGQPALLGGSKKVLKTSQLVDLAVSIATGKAFLGNFEVVAPARVGLFSGESGGAVLKETFRRVCRAKGIAVPKRSKVWWSLKLPQLSLQEDLDLVGAQIRKHKLKIVIIDPLYLCLLAGSLNVDASNLYQVGPLLAHVAEVCLEAGATPILAHHTKKGVSKSFEQPELEDLAYAGVQEFARQWLLVGRREKYELGSGVHRLWLNVGGSAGFSGCWAVDIDEGKLMTDFTGRCWKVEVRSEADEQVNAAQRRTRESADDKRADELIEREKILKVLREHPEGETKSGIKTLAGIGGEKLGEHLTWLVRDGEIEPTKIIKAAGQAKQRSYDAFRMSAGR